MSALQKNPIYIVDGARSPFLRSHNVPGPFSASDMATYVGRQILLRQPLAPEAIDEVVLGCMMPSENEANIGRIVAMRLGCGENTPGWTVQRNCASGMQALDSALKDIVLGRSQLVLCGGTETMSRAPLIFNKQMTLWFSQLSKSKKAIGKLGQLAKLRPSYIMPIIALLKGLTDPLIGLNMPQTAEIMAYRFGITREDMDAYAQESQTRAALAQDSGFFEEIVSLIDSQGHHFSHDDGVRRDTTLEKLSKLRSITNKRFGLLTAGNSSQVTDGSAMLMLASEEAVRKHNLEPIARICDVQWSALNPEVMGLGPVYATTPLLQRNNMTLDDVDYWEINEAFAAQVLGCLRAWESDKFCQEQLGLSGALGSIDSKRLNVDGGAIALGHPVGASGARIVMHLIQVLQRNNARKGIASICIGGGQGGSMLIEKL